MTFKNKYSPFLNTSARNVFCIRLRVWMRLVHKNVHEQCIDLESFKTRPWQRLRSKWNKVREIGAGEYYNSQSHEYFLSLFVFGWFFFSHFSLSKRGFFSLTLHALPQDFLPVFDQFDDTNLPFTFYSMSSHTWQCTNGTMLPRIFK